MRSIDELWRARCLVSDRRSRRGLHHIPPRARWRPLTRRPRVPVRTPVRSPDLTLRRLSVTPRAGDAPSPRARRRASPRMVRRGRLPRGRRCVRGRRRRRVGVRAPRGSSGSPPPASCAPIARTSRTPRCAASPRLAPTNPHPSPSRGHPDELTSRRGGSRPPSAPPGRAPPLLQTERVRDGPARVGRPRAPSPSSTLSSPPPPTASPTPSPRRRLRSPAPDPASSSSTYALPRLIPGDAARTVKLQHNRGGGGCFPLHYDNPGPPSRRALTCILYLNPDWTEGDGGELLLTPFLSGTIRVRPKHDRLAVFLSDRILHRVLPAKAERFCLTVGWTARDERAGGCRASTPGVGDGEPRRGGGALRVTPSQRAVSRAVYPDEYELSLMECMAGAEGCSQMLASHEAHVRAVASNAPLARFVDALPRDETRRRRHRADDDRVVDRGGATGWIRGGETTSRDTKRRTRADPGCAPARARRWGRVFGGSGAGPPSFRFRLFRRIARRSADRIAASTRARAPNARSV